MIIKKQIEELKEDTIRYLRIIDKLEQRLSKIEKVLESHAKCIGEIRKEKNNVQPTNNRTHTTRSSYS